MQPERWYVHENDVIGGWSVLNVDRPPSQVSHHRYPHEREVCTFVHREDAEHMVELHNRWARWHRDPFSAAGP